MARIPTHKLNFTTVDESDDAVCGLLIYTTSAVNSINSLKYTELPDDIADAVNNAKEALHAVDQAVARVRSQEGLHPVITMPHQET